jgi:hypothetical protein
MSLTEHEQEALAEAIAARLLRAIGHALSGGATPVAAVSTASAPPDTAPLWLPIDEYAARTRYSKRSITQWISEGLPTVGEGKARRVIVAEADRWIAARGKTRRRLGS